MSEDIDAERCSSEPQTPIAFAEPAGEETERPEAEAMEEPEAARADFANMSSLRDLAEPEEGSSEGAPREKAALEAEPRGESMMEMPGHHWLKINVEKPAKAEASPVDVTVEQAAEDRGGAAVEREAVAAGQRPAGASAVEDEEPVFDLFQLGAVEYVEEAQTRR